MLPSTETLVRTIGDREAASFAVCVHVAVGDPASARVNTYAARWRTNARSPDDDGVLADRDASAELIPSAAVVCLQRGAQYPGGGIARCLWSKHVRRPLVVDVSIKNSIEPRLYIHTTRAHDEQSLRRWRRCAQSNTAPDGSWTSSLASIATAVDEQGRRKHLTGAERSDHDPSRRLYPAEETAREPSRRTHHRCQSSTRLRRTSPRGR